VHIVDKGAGTPIVLIPGLQGRWEYMAATVDALARSFRVLSFALCGERASGLPFDPSRGLDNDSAQVAAVLDEKKIDRAVVCGMSFGGLVALRFAATHPERTLSLVLASTPPPVWHLRRRHEIYARAPWIFGPLFLIETPLRLRGEMATTFPSRKARWRFALRQLRTFLRAPVSLRAMGERARLLSPLDLSADCARIAAPTLVVTGEQHLDHVVPATGASEYVRLIPGAREVVLERTGHLGAMTRPDRFAALVRDFVERPRNAAA
jgi:pimeloyl-ACP methyl ester carboxylesterase